MAIKGFNDIIDNKGYKVNLTDRKIFERKLSKSFFGIGKIESEHYNNADSIEFILYDSNDNQLPQGETGELVRYIYLDDARIREYITINNIPKTKHENDANEYSINVENLIKDAGYSNGIFKVQITLLNRRVGSDISKDDKLWIHEISPSRTEIRVLPVKDDDGNILSDLSNRYNVFLRDGNFRDDTIYFINEFIEHINIQKVLETILASKGSDYINLIKTEFKIYDFDVFLNDIKIKYMKAMLNYAENRNYDITSINFGKPLPTIPGIELSVIEIQNIAIDILVNIIDHMLPSRDILKDSKLTLEEQITIDELNEIVKTTISEITIDTGEPTELVVDTEEIDPIIDIKRPPPPMETTTKTFYVWSDVGTIKYKNRFGKSLNKDGKEFDKLKITYSGTPIFIGDIREMSKIKRKSSKPPKPTTGGGNHISDHNQIHEYDDNRGVREKDRDRTFEQF